MEKKPAQFMLFSSYTYY